MYSCPTLASGHRLGMHRCWFVVEPLSMYWNMVYMLIHVHIYCMHCYQGSNWTFVKWKLKMSYSTSYSNGVCFSQCGICCCYKPLSVCTFLCITESQESATEREIPEQFELPWVEKNNPLHAVRQLKVKFVWKRGRINKQWSKERGEEEKEKEKEK